MSPDMPGRPTGGLRPTAERASGIVLPYRGMEQHGVPASDNSQAVPEYDVDLDDIEYEEEPEVIEPIPVRIVQESGRETRRSVVFRSFARGTTTGGGPNQVVSDDFVRGTRYRVRIQNDGATDVFIGHDSSLTANNGWVLGTGEIFEDSSEAAIYAVGSIAAETPLSVKVEYAIGRD